MFDISNSSIIICSIVRNAANGLKHNIPVINQICRAFRDYHIFVYENDSIDNTKEILIKWHNTEPEHIHISLNTLNAPSSIPDNDKIRKGVNRFFCYERIDKMAKLRNKYLEYVRNIGWKADLFMVVDLDVAQLYSYPILQTLQINKNWDMISAFGYSFSPTLKKRYHDTYALTKWEDRFIPQTEEIIYKTNHTFDKLKTHDKWVHVASAFGGLAIYRFEAICGLKYYALRNNDKKVEARCEHFSIHKQMIENGFSNIYIVPSMSLLYQKITIKLILKKIYRLF